MSDKYVLATDDNGDLAIRTVTAEESPTANSTDIITATTDGKLAVRVVGSGGGGSDPHNLGFYADLTALQTAHPTGSDGDFAILGSTDTVWVWDSGTSAWKDTDTKGQVTSVNGQTGAVVIPDELPSQTGNSGKFLTTDGTDASWAAVGALPDQTGQSGKFLTTDGTDASWSDNIFYDSTTSSIVFNYNVSVSPYTTVIKFKNIANNTAYYLKTRSSGGLFLQLSAGTNFALFGNFVPQREAAGTLTIGYYNGFAPENGSWDNVYTKKITRKNTSIDVPDVGGTMAVIQVNTTITLAAADWSSNTQTVNVAGMTATGVVMVSPDPTDQSAYTSAGIICTAQSTNSLTFTCTSTPSADLTVNVVCL